MVFERHYKTAVCFICCDQTEFQEFPAIKALKHIIILPLL